MTKVMFGLLVGAGAFIAGLAYGGYCLYAYIEYDPTFCGSCHIMEKAWQTWQAGPHNRVNCHTCHQQGLGDRARIVWHWATQEYQDIPPHSTCPQGVRRLPYEPGSALGPDRGNGGSQDPCVRANLQCLSCHLPSLHAVEPTVEACQTCHIPARTSIGGMVGFHCTTCHNFLAKAAAEILPERETCLACHATMQVKGETFPEGTPMAFACVDCHKPHTKPFLQFQDCLSCHTAVLEDHAHFERRAFTRCVECHQPHSWRTTEWR